MMYGDKMTVEQLQGEIKRVVKDAVWGGLSKEVISAILRAEAEVARER